MKSGCSASEEGTRRFAQRALDEGNPDSTYGALGRTGLVTSSLGFGSYQLDDRTPEHAAALEKALLGGVNLIDTCTNYTTAREHHCAVAQLPAKLFESGAMLTRNCVTGNRTALEFAQEHDLAVLVNRPLNVFYREQLIRLADTPVRSPEVHAHVDPFLRRVGPTKWGRGIRRATVIVGADGRIKKVFENVARQGHAAEALAALKRGTPMDSHCDLMMKATAPRMWGGPWC